MKRWGITFDEPYEVAENTARKVEYANSNALKAAIIKKYTPSRKQVQAPAPNNEKQAEDEKKPPVRVV